VNDFIVPAWPAPSHVKAFTTTRRGGVSLAPYDSFNLALHVGDDPTAVTANRARLKHILALPAEPIWLEQVHGCTVVSAEAGGGVPRADAVVSFSPDQVCVVMTADCMPILLTDAKGSRIGAVHAGWRGLADGVIEAAYQRLAHDNTALMAWIGPSILQAAFEVGDDVRDIFCAEDRQFSRFFSENARGRWQADLVSIAREKLHKVGASGVYGGDRCTYTEAQNFFSFRRDNKTGRMATLIWLTHGH
jgi:YfiH family protein